MKTILIRQDNKIYQTASPQTLENYNISANSKDTAGFILENKVGERKLFVLS